MQFPLTFWDTSLLLAVTTIVLLLTVELTSSYFGRRNLLINKKRLRRAALTVGILFLTAIALIMINVITTR